MWIITNGERTERLPNQIKLGKMILLITNLSPVEIWRNREQEGERLLSFPPSTNLRGLSIKFIAENLMN